MNAAVYTLHNGGGTFRASDLAPVNPTSGYAVAVIRGTAISLVGLSAVNYAAIERGIVAVRDTFKTPYVGTWLDRGTVHIDPVVILPDYGSAVIVGRAFGQEAIWSFLTGRAIVLADEPADSYFVDNTDPVLGVPRPVGG